MSVSEGAFVLRQSHILYAWLFAVFVGIGPVYWFPFVPVALLEGFKIALYLSIVLPPILVSLIRGGVYFPGGKVSVYLFFSFALISVPAILQGAPDAAAYRAQSVLQVLLFLHAAGYLISLGMVEYVLKRAVGVFLLFASASLLFIAFIPGYQSPLNDALFVVQTGLGGSRTGWSPSMAIYLPWLYSSQFFGFGISIFGGLVLLGNQVIVAGRTGMVATVIPFLVWGFLTRRAKNLIIVALLIILAGFYIFENLDLLRLNVGGFQSRSSLDELSTGRMGQYFEGIDAIWNRPFLGYGVGVLKFGEGRWTLHNEFLKIAVEGGLFYLAILLAILALAVKRGVADVARFNSVKLASLLTVLAGVVAAMFEPEVLFGSFNKASFWWLCYSVCISRNSQ